MARTPLGASRRIRGIPPVSLVSGAARWNYLRKMRFPTERATIWELLKRGRLENARPINLLSRCYIYRIDRYFDKQNLRMLFFSRRRATI